MPFEKRKFEQEGVVSEEIEENYNGKKYSNGALSVFPSEILTWEALWWNEFLSVKSHTSKNERGPFVYSSIINLKNCLVRDSNARPPARQERVNKVC